jgi:hypothetical protein
MKLLSLLIDEVSKVFRKPTPLELAKEELVDAQRSLLQSESAQEYSKRMSLYHRDRIKRLTMYINDMQYEHIIPKWGNTLTYRDEKSWKSEENQD